MPTGESEQMSEKNSPTLGVHLLETVTRGMYSQPFHSVREYIQNAYDSIRKARREGQLKPDEGEIKLYVDKNQRRLSISDTGSGLSPEEAAVNLLDIGHSDKARTTEESAHNAGFRGIGRLAGISYCKKLRFETTNGDGLKCTVEFNAAGINQLTEPGQEPTTIVNAINANSTIDDCKCGVGQHYLKVTLEGLDAGSPFLDETKLHDYLALHAPVAHDPSTWTHGEAIQRLAEESGHPESIEDVRVLICDHQGRLKHDVRRPFRNSFQTANARGGNPRTVRVREIKGLPIIGSTSGSYWGWLAVHEREGALADAPYAGLRIRMHNIAVGDDSIIGSLFTTPNLARWCFGEVHVTDLSLVPNSQRDEFEPSPQWDELRTRLRSEAQTLEQEIRRESSERNRSIASLERTTRGLIEQAKDAIAAGFNSHEEKERTLDKLDRTSEKLEREAGRRKRSEDEKEQLLKLRDEVAKTEDKVRKIRRTRADDATSHLSRQSRNVLQTVYKVLKEELPTRQFSEIQEKINTALKPGKKTKG